MSQERSINLWWRLLKIVGIIAGAFLAIAVGWILVMCYTWAPPKGSLPQGQAHMELRRILREKCPESVSPESLKFNVSLRRGKNGNLIMQMEDGRQLKGFYDSMDGGVRIEGPGEIFILTQESPSGGYFMRHYSKKYDACVMHYIGDVVFDEGSNN
jgi:hypothetical protein